MLYVKIDSETGKACAVLTPSEVIAMRNADGPYLRDIRCRGDWKSFAQAAEVAAQLNASCPDKYMATDAGPSTAPRYDVIAVPKVGELVSESFNGDTSPAGEIVKITPTLRITTSTGRRFNRIKESGCWAVVGGYGYMIAGYKTEQNPHF